MDRGTYNHVVEYLSHRRRVRRKRKRSRVRAGSVIPPGQSGHVSPSGQESRHFEDQLSLYTGWRYKPMPLLEPHAKRLAESTTTLSYSP
jgi:hypothetical protein